MKIRYIGELLDHTGYGIAARTNVALLHKMGHTLECIPTGSKSSNDPDWKVQLVLQNLATEDSAKVNPDIVIVHLYPPQALKDYKVPGVPLVAYIAWETDLLSSIWANALNQYADYVITTCTEMQKVFVRSGVKKPVYQIGPTLFERDLKIDTEAPKATQRLREISDNPKFKFYSIFQWIERKDPRKLINAYIQEFDNNEDVVLVLKTYRLSYDKSEFQHIVNEIRVAAKENGIPYPPEIRLIPHQLSEQEMYALHDICDCYVSPHRGEGTGLGIIDAIVHKNPVITTPYGGPQDFCEPAGTHLLKYEMKSIQNPVQYMNYFNGYMKWADADLDDLRRAMRTAYESKGEFLDPEGNYGCLNHVYGDKIATKNMENILSNIK